MNKKNLYTLDEMENEFIGEKGTEERDIYDDNLKSFLIGEAIRQERQKKNLTQAQLGKLIGVQRSQVSRIESGKNLTISTIAKVFKAMGIKAELKLEGISNVALW